MANLYLLHDAMARRVEDAPMTPDMVILDHALEIICSHGDSAVEYAIREIARCAAGLRVQAQWILIRRRIGRLMDPGQMRRVINCPAFSVIE